MSDLICNTSGHVFTESKMVTVERKGDCLVFEFIGNYVLPMRVEGDTLYIMNKCVAAGVDYISVCMVSIRSNGSLTFEIDIDMCSMECIIAGGYFIGSHHFRESDMLAWMGEIGIERIKGCGLVEDWYFNNNGCSCRRVNDTAVFSFDNGLVFPVFFVKDGVQICQVFVPCTSDAALWIRVRKFTAERIVFDVLVHYDISEVERVSGLVLDTNGVVCKGELIPARTITKLLVMGGKYCGQLR